MNIKKLKSEVYAELIPFYDQNDFVFDKRKCSFSRGDCKVLWGVTSKHASHIFFRLGFSVVNEEINIVLDKLYLDQTNSTLFRVQSRDLAREFNCFDYDNYVSEGGRGLSIFYSVDETTDIVGLVNKHKLYMTRCLKFVTSD